MRARLPALAIVLSLAGASCFGGSDNVTPEGKGRPVVTIEMPAQVAAGSTETAALSISNPGPGDMSSVVVAFAFVGPVSSAGEVPAAVVGLGAKGENPAVLSVSPEPRAVSPDGVVYVFEGLRAGEDTTISFDLRMPEEPGSPANSITVYDGSDPERAAGVRLQTTVR